MKHLNPQAVGVTWLHSWEEDAGGELVYRPDGFAFPPSRRGRDGFALAADGTLTVLVPGPADRHVESDGTWAETASGVELTLGARVLRVTSADADRLTAESV